MSGPLPVLRGYQLERVEAVVDFLSCIAAQLEALAVEERQGAAHISLEDDQREQVGQIPVPLLAFAQSLLGLAQLLYPEPQLRIRLLKLGCTLRDKGRELLVVVGRPRPGTYSPGDVAGFQLRLRPYHSSSPGSGPQFCR
jgi:hypothetical protein